MADIDVVPKKKTSLWLWIIAAIIVAVIVFMLLGGVSDSPNGVGELRDTLTLAAGFVGTA